MGEGEAEGEGDRGGRGAEGWEREGVEKDGSGKGEVEGERKKEG